MSVMEAVNLLISYRKAAEQDSTRIKARCPHPAAFTRWHYCCFYCPIWCPHYRCLV